MNEIRYRQLTVEQHLTVVNCSWDGLKIAPDSMGGHGLFATRDFREQEWVCDYGGVLLDHKMFVDDCKAQEDKFMLEIPVGTTSYFLNHYKTTPFSYGRMANHSAKHSNLTKRVFRDMANQPIVLFKAKRDIKAGEEMVHNYGRDYKEVLMPCVLSCWTCKGESWVTKSQVTGHKVPSQGSQSPKSRVTKSQVTGHKVPTHGSQSPKSRVTVTSLDLDSMVFNEMLQKEQCRNWKRGGISLFVNRPKPMMKLTTQEFPGMGLPRNSHLVQLLLFMCTLQVRQRQVLK
jgi:hypothetical protein